MITVIIPSQLESYTNGQRELNLDIAANGRTLQLADVIDALETQFRGLRFRIVDERDQIRRHIAVFVGETLVRSLTAPVGNNGRVQIVGALSGG